MFESGGPSFPSDVARQLTAALQKLHALGAAEQMERIVIPRQKLGGTADLFSFLAYPWPSLSREQRSARELQSFEPIKVELEGVSFEIHLDDFGQINWFYVKGCPALFFRIGDLLEHA